MTFALLPDPISRTEVATVVRDDVDDWRMLNSTNRDPARAKTFGRTFGSYSLWFTTSTNAYLAQLHNLRGLLRHSYGSSTFTHAWHGLPYVQTDYVIYDGSVCNNKDVRNTSKTPFRRRRRSFRRGSYGWAAITDANSRACPTRYATLCRTSSVRDGR